VPIHFTDRTHGASKIPRTQIMLSAVDLLKLAGKRLLRTRGYLIFRTTKQDEKHEHKAYGCNGLQSISSEKCAHDWNDMYACPGSHAASGLARAHHSETGRAMHGWMRLLGVLMQKPIVTMRDAFNPRRAGYGKYFGR
jgi:hypothetical protein